MRPSRCLSLRAEGLAGKRVPDCILILTSRLLHSP